jgi:hypothetical protein
MPESHMCVGPTCWTCGEPTELREMRHSMMGAFTEEKVANTPWRLAQIAMGAIREDILDMMTKIVTLENEVWLLKRGPLSRVEIDPNVRVRGNQTFSGLENVYGPIAIGQAVQVFEPEANIVGDAWVSDIDNDKGLVYLRVMWSSLRDKENSGGVSMD